MTCSRSVFAIGLLAFLTCCKPSEPTRSEEASKTPEPEWPTEQEIRTAMPQLNGCKIRKITKGAIYRSDGWLGPEGNLVFPIRLDLEEFSYDYQLHKNAWKSERVDIKFYKNQFGEWLYRR